MKIRKEKDALGTVDVPVDFYGGSFTVRALKNFQISSLRAPESYKMALALVKQCAAEVNAELGILDKKHAKALVQAADEFMDGRFDSDFDLDMYQAGAGTAFNMNLNEILANRANELLGGKKGKYHPIHPNDHVNKGQSSNDVNPTAIRLAALMDLGPLMDRGLALIDSFEKKAKAFSKMKKVGRTHLQDAVPITLGQELKAYASSLSNALLRVETAAEELTAIGMGATAVGTGINAHPQFAEKMRGALGRKMSIEFTEMNLFENNHSMASFLNVSAALRGLATELLRICNDLRLMASGPDAGLKEIELPEVEPGSSIMPGKVNPSVPECMSMICVQVIGLDAAISLAAQQGQLELNWYTPLIAWDLLHQMEILTNGMAMLRTDCIEGIRAHENHMKETLEKSSAYATELSPKLGYKKVAELVKEAKRKKVPFSKVTTSR